MKNILIITLLFLGSTFAATAQIKSAKLTASGLTCSMCSKAIFKGLEKVSFIDKIETDIQNSTYTITFKPNATVNLDDIKKAVVDAGFSVARLDVTANFLNTPVANDTHLTFDGSTYHFVNVPQATLNGEKTFRILDENFTSKKEHRKYAKYTDMKCYETGKMESCCKEGKSGARVYHVTI